MIDSTKVLCPVFEEIDMLIPGDSRAFSRLWTKSINQSELVGDVAVPVSVRQAVLF